MKLIVIYVESSFCVNSSPDMKMIWNYDLLLFSFHKFMSGYLYFSNNLKDIKDQI